MIFIDVSVVGTSVGFVGVFGGGIVALLLMLLPLAFGVAVIGVGIAFVDLALVFVLGLLV